MSADVDDFFKKLGGASSLVNTPKVTSSRSSGSTTLAVDNCNWDQTTGKIFATYQVDSSGAVVDGSQTIWKGVVTSTTAIGSMARIAGASDSGNDVGDYVELLPASAWANDLIEGILTEHDQDGTHGDINPSSVSTNTINEGTSGSGVTIDSVLLKDGLVQQLGAVQQIKYTETSTPSSGTTQIPADSSLPQNTEGDEYMSLSITPKSSTNTLKIEVVAWLTTGTASRFIAGALFQDSTANALAASDVFQASSGGSIQLVLKHSMVAGTTSATTFKFRAGLEGTGTLTFGGVSSKFGAAGISSITITEYKAS